MPSFNRLRSVIIVLFALIALEHELTHAADWPTLSRRQCANGVEQISVPLNLAWKYESPALPEMAWSDGEGRVIEEKLLGNRVKFDDVFHPVVVGGKLLFGATDDQLHFADARIEATGVSIFDVQFNGTTVLTDVTLTGTNGKEVAAIVHEIKDVNVTDNLRITLVAKQGVPLLNAVKVLRND